MTRAEYIIYLAEKVASGEIDFSRVRKELQRHRLNERETRSMIKLIDSEVRSTIVAQARRQRQNSYTMVGSLMAIAGFITSISFMGMGPVVYYIGYAPFATGLGLIAAGRRPDLQSFGSRRRRFHTSFRNRLHL